MAGSIFIPLKTVLDDAGIKNAQKAFGSLGKSIKGTLGAIGVGFGIAAITNGLTQAAKAATADVKAQALLATQLKNTTGATVVQITQTESFIQKLQMQTAILDDELRPAMASLVRATGDVSQAQTLLALATDVAAATGKDLQSVSLALGKAVSGQTTALFRMIPGLKGSSDWMGKLQAETKGAAEAAANNDPFARLTVIFNDIQEQVGMVLLPTLQELAAWFASPEGQAKLAEFVAVIKKAVGQLVSLAEWVAENISWLEPLAIAIGVATVAMTAFNLVMDTNPIVLMTLALAALANVLVTIAKNASDASNAINNIPNNYYGRGSSQYARGVNATNSPTSSSGFNTTTLSGILDASKTSTVVSKVLNTQTKASKGVSAATKAAADAAKAAAKAAEEQAQAYLKAAEAGQQLVDETRKMLGSFTDLFKVKPDLGAFEQSAVDAFTNIFDTIDSALADGRILSDAAARLREYAKSEQATLQGIARQRDLLAKKIDVARSITSGVMGLVNVTNLLETTSKSVTETVISISNGISVATTRTFDVVTSGGLVSNFQKLVDKTKAFAKNLVDLKKLGLNKQLFAQLVQAGADAGGATAQALVDGGAETISALNSLYNELALSASDIASNATDTLYEVGQQVVSNGFIEGLLSQDSELQRAAQTLADAFASTFTGELQSAVNAALPDVNGLGNQVENLGGGGGGGLNGGRALMVASMGRGTIYNVNVSAGVVTDPNALARTVIDSVKKYERSNGSVWVAA